jgi:2-keto-4-pentenoate hydratase/2-oxohepta-3-ene-1,7-dioic acid hydratase in catechol pathway
MRFVAADGRASLVRGDVVFDVAECSGGAIPADPMLVLRDHWDDLAAVDLAGEGRPLGEVTLGAPVPRPPLILSLIANYPPAGKSGFPMIVGKAPSAVTGPHADIVLPDPRRLPLGRAYVIAEPELAVVTRAAGRYLSPDAARGAIAGYAVAQDITERVHEFGPAPSPWTWENLPAKTLGKSIDTFCPLGPAVVTPDETVGVGAGALEKRCWINGELTHQQRHDDMLWSPAELVALVSCFATLQAGTVLLCGAGGRLDGRPPPGLAAGDVIRTEIAGVGVIENRCRNESAIPFHGSLPSFP